MELLHAIPALPVTDIKRSVALSRWELPDPPTLQFVGTTSNEIETSYGKKAKAD